MKLKIELETKDDIDSITIQLNKKDKTIEVTEVKTNDEVVEVTSVSEGTHKGIPSNVMDIANM